MGTLCGAARLYRFKKLYRNCRNKQLSVKYHKFFARYQKKKRLWTECIPKRGCHSPPKRGGGGSNPLVGAMAVCNTVQAAFLFAPNLRPLFDLRGCRCLHRRAQLIKSVHEVPNGTSEVRILLWVPWQSAIQCRLLFYYLRTSESCSTVSFFNFL